MLDSYETETGDFALAINRVTAKVQAVSDALELAGSENPGFYGGDALTGFGLVLGEVVADLETIGARLYGDGRTADPVRCTAKAEVEKTSVSTGL
jgi:hypothetical protein